ncbi:MAG: winged helix-turn-helix domain-containing protein, partial [Pseudomonadota bacterium]
MRYGFGDFILDTGRVELTQAGKPVSLEPKTFDLLACLVANRDRLVTKDDILDQVWPGLFVSDASISTAIKQVRRALGDTGSAQGFVKTVPRKGYRFVAEVEELAGTNPAKVEAPLLEGLAPDSAKTGTAPVLAVLRFVLLQSEGAQEAIADAIPIELIAALSRTRGTRIIARGSSFRFDPAHFDVSEIRTQLGAGYVLSGSVELSGQKLFVSTELADTRSGAVIWSERFSGKLDDLFAIRHNIVQQVCAAIELRIPLHEADAHNHVPTDALDAWGHYHIGLRHLHRVNAADIERALHHMERAITLDPGFARAYAGLSMAEAEVYNLFYGTDRQASLTRTVHMAEKGFELDPHDPFCNHVLGRARWFAEDLDGAMDWTNRAILLNPNHALAQYNLGKLNAIACQGAEADQLAASAMTLSPLDPHLQSMLSARALAGFVSHNEMAALEHAKASLRAPNPHLYVRLFAGAIFQTYGHKAQAGAALKGI